MAFICNKLYFFNITLYIFEIILFRYRLNRSLYFDRFFLYRMI